MVEYSDTPIGPVGWLYSAVTHAVTLTVDHDHATRAHPQLIGALDIIQIRIIDMNRLIEAGIALLVVEDITPFRRTLIPFPLLVSLWGRPQGNPVAFDL